MGIETNVSGVKRCKGEPPRTQSLSASDNVGLLCGTGGRTWDARWLIGRAWEEVAVEALRARKWMTLPTAAISTSSKGAHGPRFEGEVPNDYLTVPDILACKEGKSAWFEIKYKADTTIHRNTGRTEVGIPGRLWGHYMGVERETGIPVVYGFIIGSEKALYLAYQTKVNKHKRVYDGPNMPGAMVFFDIRSFTRIELPNTTSPEDTMSRCKAVNALAQRLEEL